MISSVILNPIIWLIVLVSLNYYLNKGFNFLMFLIWFLVICWYGIFYMFSAFLYSQGRPELGIFSMMIFFANLPYLIYLLFRFFQIGNFSFIIRDFWYISFPVLLCISLYYVMYFFEK